MYTEELYQKLKKYVAQTASPFMIKLLINGLIVDIIYQKGILQKITMIESGSDHLEVDVTQVVRTSMDVPDKISFNGFLKVRANVIHTFSDFEKMNVNDEYLHHKDLTEKMILQQVNCEQTKLRVIVLNIAEMNGSGVLNEMERLEFLMNQGFHVVYHERMESGCEEMMRYYNIFKDYHRKEIGYSVTGLQILPVDSHGGTEGFLLPFSPDETLLTVEDITFVVNSTGKIEPDLKIKATDLAGERYFHYRFPDISMIKSLGILIGDQVKMSDVHTILNVKKEKRTGGETRFVQPEICPVCGDRLMIEAKQLYCMNNNCWEKSESNQDSQKRRLEGMTVVITGTLSIRRYDFRKLIEQSGGMLAGAVTQQTDVLLMGAKGIGTVKYRKAQSLNIPIVTEEQFRLMLE